jgi:hypothetical protein
MIFSGESKCVILSHFDVSLDLSYKSRDRERAKYTAKQQNQNSSMFAQNNFA